LQYALSAYLDLIKRDPPSLAAAVHDDTFFEQIDRDVTESGSDQKPVRNKIEEITKLLQKASDPGSSPAVMAADIARRGGEKQSWISLRAVIIVAIIGAIATIGAALINNWKQLPWSKVAHPAPAAAPANPPVK